MRKLFNHNLFKAVLFLVLAGLSFYVEVAVAQTQGGTTSGLAGIAGNVQSSFGNIAKLITGASFLAGLGFAFAAILKFKAHRDNPTQIPVGTPIALLVVAVCLMFLPYLFKQAGVTVFGTAKPGSVAGVSGLVSS